MKVYVLEEDTMDLLRKLQADLHGASKKERDAGHKLWLLLDRAHVAHYNEETDKLVLKARPRDLSWAMKEYK